MNDSKLITSLMNNPNIGIEVCDDKGIILSANDAFQTFTGFPEEELIGMNLREISTDETITEELDGRQQVLRGDRAHYSLKKGYLTRDGKRVWGDVTIMPVSDADGGCRSLVSMVVDITQNHRDRLLHQGRNKVLELLYRNSSVNTICETIVSFIEAMESGTFCSILLLDEEKNRLFKAAAPSLPDFYNEAINGMRIGEGVGSCGTAAFRGERVIIADILNHPFWERSKGLVLRTPLRSCWSEPIFSRDGEVLGTFAIYYNRTREPNKSELSLIRSAAALTALALNHKNAEKVLRESEEKLSLVLSTMSDAVYLIDEEGRFIFCNTPAELTTYTSDQLINKRYQDVLPRSISEKLGMAIRDNREGRVHEFENIIKKDNMRIYQAAKLTPRFVDGLYTGSTGVLRDITHLKETEESLRAFDRVKNEFISTAAHELRTPLTSILGYTELLCDEDQFGAFPPEEQREFLLEVYAKGELLSHIIDDLLDISKIEGGYTITLNKKPAPIKQIVGKVVKHFQLHAPQHEIRVRHQPHLPEMIDLDDDRITQVLENIISNAIKYSPAGGPVTVAVSADDENLFCTVSDSGMGMTNEQLTHAFDKFYRGNAGNTAIGGLGIGLSIVRQIVEAHGGTIVLESEYDVGTCANITIPLCVYPSTEST